MRSPLTITVQPGRRVPGEAPEVWACNPPLAENWNPFPPAPYGVPTTPFGASLDTVSTSAGTGEIVIVHVKFGEVCPATSVTATVNGWLAPGWAASPVRGHR